MEFDYYYGDEAEQFSFIRIPKIMLTDERFSVLSLSAKILYGLLLDRMSLSAKNGWLDEERRVYIIFKIEEIQEMLGFSKKKSIEYLNELEELGLVEKKRRGLGLPSILYIKSFITADSAKNDENGTSRGVEIDTSVKATPVSDSQENIGKTEESCSKNDDFTVDGQGFGQKSCVRGVDLGTSGGVENALQEVSIRGPLEVSICTPLMSNTKGNNININNTKSNLILSADNMTCMAANESKDGFDGIDVNEYAKTIREKLEIDLLIHNRPLDADIIEGIYDLVFETLISRRDSMIIDSNRYPMNLVRRKFIKLDSSHVEYVADMLKENTTKVKNIKKYLLTCLFNATTTMGSYYRAEVNHDRTAFYTTGTMTY